MKRKRSVTIAFRTDEEVKKLLDEIAEEKEWTLSQVVDKLCRDSLKEKLEKEKES